MGSHTALSAVLAFVLAALAGRISDVGWLEGCWESTNGDRVAYEAHPSGQAPATFFSTTITDSSVVFENLEHDFPQRVGYRLDGASRLLAWVEGTAEGRTRRIEFPYQRAACGQ
ncbi:MAG TPA: DUF6265 family protein [Vicinamibacterales bacterium]|nr:DUF6265 family protein [Vicinamibacterales bacterium]